MSSSLTKKLGRQAVAEMLATVCRGKGCPATYELGCPFKNGEGGTIPCESVQPDFWLEAMKEPAPEFHFGDKVLWKGEHMVFVRYEKTGRTKTAIVVSETCQCLFERCPADLKAGWDG